MRLLSALMAGVTALFTFLFVREALPGAPWAWTVGGLGAALAPLLGFISGSGDARRDAVRGLRRRSSSASRARSGAGSRGGARSRPAR